MAIPATASSPAATEPTFLDAAPVKLGPDPVFDGATGVIGEPEATPDPDPDPDPEPEFEPDPTKPVGMGPDEAVPVTNPVAPATPLVTIAVVFVHEHSLSKYVDVDVYTTG